MVETIRQSRYSRAGEGGGDHQDVLNSSCHSSSQSPAPYTSPTKTEVQCELGTLLTKGCQCEL